MSIQLVEAAFQLRVRAANLIDNRLCPIEVRALALECPVSRRAGDDVSQIAYLVCELHELRCLARISGFADLEALAGILLKPFRVCNFKHRVCNVIPELPT